MACVTRDGSFAYLKGVAVTEDGRGSGWTDQWRSIGTGSTSNLVIRSWPGFRRIREHIGRHVVVHWWSAQCSCSIDLTRRTRKRKSKFQETKRHTKGVLCFAAVTRLRILFQSTEVMLTPWSAIWPVKWKEKCCFFSDLLNSLLTVSTIFFLSFIWLIILVEKNNLFEECRRVSGSTDR